MNVKTAVSILGSDLGSASKMPGRGFGLSALDCQTGGRLRDVAGSTCEHCYAMGANYQYPSVRISHARRLANLDQPDWVDAMVYLINRREDPAQGSKKATGYFRWHDSGDLQEVWHLANICAVAARTPGVAHWCPTREYRIVREYIESGGEIPANLCLRLSAHKIGGVFGTGRPMGLPYSTVSSDSMDGAHECPARFQENKCGECRACWDVDVDHINYHLH